MRLALNIVALICSVTVCQAQTNLLVPLNEHDFRLAGVALGSDLVQAVAAVGVLDSTRQAQGPNGETLSWSFHPGLTLAAHPEGIYYISVSSPDFPTSRGLHVGDDANRIPELYGPPSKADDNGLIYCESAEAECVRFARFVVEQGRVRELVITAPLD